MEANEFVGFTLPVVNAGPWSYFSNGAISEDGEDETMIVDGIIDASATYIDETSKTIYDAIASGKTVIIKFVDDSLGIVYSLITEFTLNNDVYTFYYTINGETQHVYGTANENPEDPAM